MQRESMIISENIDARLMIVFLRGYGVPTSSLGGLLNENRSVYGHIGKTHSTKPSYSVIAKLINYSAEHLTQEQMKMCGVLI